MYISPFTFTVKYPEKQCDHMINVVQKYKPVLDENYTYRDRSFSWRFRRFFLDLLLNLAVLPVTALRYGVKIEGKENLKIHKKELKNGFVTVCNHVCEWDFLVILLGFYPKKAFFPIWARNMETPMAPTFKLIGGIPVSTTIHGGKKFIQAMDSVLEEKKWLHIYAEGSMWWFYPAVREFQDGASYFSVKHNVPLLPLAISYREPKGLYKLFKKHPNLTLHIGKPIMPPVGDLKRKEAERILKDSARLSVMHLMGIRNEEENRKLMEMYK